MKLTHAEVNYRQATFPGRRCGVCSMYVKGKPIKCTLVQSPIRPYCVCQRFEPKEEAHASSQRSEGRRAGNA